MWIFDHWGPLVGLTVPRFPFGNPTLGPTRSDPRRLVGTAAFVSGYPWVSEHCCGKGPFIDIYR